MVTPAPKIEVNLTRAQALYQLALVTEDRTTTEQEALLYLAGRLDGLRPVKKGRRVVDVEASWQRG